MTKAKTIDRIELTRKKFGLKNHRPHHEQELAPTEELCGLSECPNCRAKSLRRDGGCMSCLACGWSACG